MTKHAAPAGLDLATIRAGVISALILALCYLYATGLSSLPRVWTFIVFFAVCFVLMMKSLVDLFVWSFALASRSSGSIIGRTVKSFRRAV